ncbi:MAG TPA: HEAT repeat domain-containing protein [Planctomycetaceae bacterium]|nr:HEAT repeat domain-containing protein [Planctomycetaceae bacterium]
MTNQADTIRHADARNLDTSRTRRLVRRARSRQLAGWTVCGLLAGLVALADARGDEVPPTTAEGPTVLAAEFRSEPPADPQVARAIEGLSSLDLDVRRDSAARLAWLGSQAREAVPALLECLSDREYVVRAHAAKALWDVAQRPEAIPALVELLDVVYPGGRPLASYFLGHIGPSAYPALPVLRRCMEASNAIERVHLAEAIARIDADDEQAVAVLIDGLHSSAAEIRFVAAYALGDVSPQHGERVVPALSAAQRDADDAVRTAASLALQAFRTPTRYATDGIIVEAALRAQAPAPGGQPATGDQRFGEPHCLEIVPITALSLSIAPPMVGESGEEAKLPFDHFAACKHDLESGDPCVAHRRNWMMTAFHWEATAFCHRPLYFEEPNLERLGYSRGLCQPLVSAGHFFGTIPALPYLMHAQPYCKCVYTLGEFRPGSCAPYLCHCPPLSLHGAGVQAAVTTALFLAIY